MRGYDSGDISSGATYTALYGAFYIVGPGLPVVLEEYKEIRT